LIKNNLSKDNISGIPVLMKIPFIGALFRWRDYSQSDKEIVITVTPSIIRQVKKETPAKEKEASQESTSAASASATIPEEIPTPEPKLPIDVSQYASLVQVKIAEAIQYPEEAKQFGWEGTVKLGIHLISDGNLSEVNIKQSSGYDLFDKVAVEAAKLQSPYPAFPAGIETTDLWIDVPITYRID
jgi:TonB family protein